MSSLHPTVIDVTQAIIERSRSSRAHYLSRIQAMRNAEPSHDRLSCGNLAHAYAACSTADKDKAYAQRAKGIAIISAYNDMLSAHQPYHGMLDQLKQQISQAGGLAMMAGGVPAMCDGITQGQPGMELSLLSRDVIALSTSIALSHDVFDGGLLLGICDKIVPGLLIGALAFGHLPFLFVPAGPMSSGISNQQKALTRQQYAEGKIDRQALLLSEAKAYHSPGTCTFYGTANSNQVMLEMMGLQLCDSSFVHPHDPLRDQLNASAVQAIMTASHNKHHGLAEQVDARALVNAISGLLATGGSTNHTIHIVAIAAAAGWQITWQDIAQLSQVTPLLARVYPNGSADVNAFHQAGGCAYIMRELIAQGLMHGEIASARGQGSLAEHCQRPALEQDQLQWQPIPRLSKDETILRPHSRPFQSNGGLQHITGDLGQGIIKISAVQPEQRQIEAPIRVFDSQAELLAAFNQDQLNQDVIVVVRFQGPRANGMPELHKLTPCLGVLQDRGYKVALVTDGRMSGASGKVPAAIHLTPEAMDQGPLAYLQDGDRLRLDADAGTLELLSPSAEHLAARQPASQPATSDTYGRHLFADLRTRLSPASLGGSIFAPPTAEEIDA